MNEKYPDLLSVATVTEQRAGRGVLFFWRKGL